MAFNLLSAMAGMSLLLAPFLYGQNFDLTGFWRDNSSGKYEIRQVGNQVFWVNDNRPAFINVFYGTIVNGNTIRGQWADLPGGRTSHNGPLVLRVDSNDHFEKIGPNGSAFGGSIFVRTGTSAASELGAERAQQGPANIAGNWQWGDNGALVTIRRDGTFAGAGSGGRWRVVDEQNWIYDFRWANGSVERAQLTADGTLVDPNGRRVLAARAP